MGTEDENPELIHEASPQADAGPAPNRPAETPDARIEIAYQRFLRCRPGRLTARANGVR